MKSLLQKNDSFWGQAFKSLFVGGGSTLVDIACWYILSTWIGIYWGNVAGYTIGTAVNYWMSNKWVFTQRSIQNPWIEKLLFYGLSMSGMLVNTLFLWGLVEALAWNSTASKIVATILTFAYNFLTKKWILYR